MPMGPNYDEVVLTHVRFQAGVPLLNDVYFEITRFDTDATNILYLGDAVPSVGTIEFNKVNYITRVSQAIYADTIPIWDRKSGKLTDFTTHFTFIIDTQGASLYGHRLTFFLAPVGFQIRPNSAGGFLGLFNTTYTDSSRNQMIVIEFDSYVNVEWDPPFEHVGINKNSISSARYTTWNASLHSGDSVDVWVSYNSTSQILNLSWSYGAGNDTGGNTSLSYQVDLREVLQERVTVGFSAATGANIERHILQYWEFNSTLNIAEKSDNKSIGWKLAVGVNCPCWYFNSSSYSSIIYILDKTKKSSRDTSGDSRLDINER
ncbi:concanavalin A-like lectin protein kinase family protein [Artemisia annua]|uniref:Concanavalin A-like lectin protein kinase family protein n=1 Tax=Artemisia annua TaxID=35608 RepID=A0A2U1LBF9_ARTAN|nr:concanavalin A-like lectin protein kinase family protein [Artemisia annua]